MRGLCTIYRRELAGLFFGPLAWILLAVALALSGISFVDALRFYGGEVTNSLAATFSASAAMLVLPPLLTMRMLSEESRSGMLEFLLTAPVTDFAVVAGKFLAAASFMAIFLSSKLVYALAIQLLGTTPDWPAVIGAYLGSVLISAVFCATGLLASAMTNTPIVAAFAGLVFNLLVFDLPSRRGLIDADVWRDLVDSLNVAEYLGYFANGVVDTAALVLFVAWTAMLLFLATRLVESRRWR